MRRLRGLQGRLPRRLVHRRQGHRHRPLRRYGELQRTDKPVDCGAFKCGATECLTTCQADTDCADGNSCVAGVCSSGARWPDDFTSLIATDGSQQLCSPFLCQGQACLKNCSASSDCADGFVCNPNDMSCEAIAANSQSASGCGCSRRWRRQESRTQPTLARPVRARPCLGSASNSPKGGAIATDATAIATRLNRQSRLFARSNST